MDKMPGEAGRDELDYYVYLAPYHLVGALPGSSKPTVGLPFH
jgi:hypothetical protein